MSSPRSSPEPVERFSDRVESYVRYRPSYPLEVIETLREVAALDSKTRVADIGSGTAIFSQLLLPHCAHVFGVEPNLAMRKAAETLLTNSPHFSSVSGTAEATGLPAASVELVTAAQSFHWFDVPACRREFRRILRPGGQVALIWNERLTAATPFLTEYDALLRNLGTDYAAITHRRREDHSVAQFFGNDPFTEHEFPNAQHFDLTGLTGRLLSSSYAPNVGHPGHEPMIAALTRLFERHQQNGAVTFLYTTKLYCGKPAA